MMDTRKIIEDQINNFDLVVIPAKPMGSTLHNAFPNPIL